MVAIRRNFERILNDFQIILKLGYADIFILLILDTVTALRTRGILAVRALFFLRTKER